MGVLGSNYKMPKCPEQHYEAHFPIYQIGLERVRKMKTLIQIVHKNKASGHKFVTIPKGEDINEGDYVVVKKVMPDDLQGNLSIEVKPK